MDAGVELTWKYLQRVAVANTGFMSAPKLVISKPIKNREFRPSDEIVNGAAMR